MKNRKILLYVLAGVWHTAYTDGTSIVGVAEEVDDLKKKLDHIRETKANEYLENSYGDIKEKVGERHYEITDAAGEYAKFYITEHYVELSELLMDAISREMKKIDHARDVEDYLDNMYVNGILEPWKYEYIKACPEVVGKIVVAIEKYECRDLSFNVIMENAVDKVMDELVLDDNKLLLLWKQFGNILIDENESILEDFVGFERGTHREDVWNWFDECHTKGVAYLMFGEKA